MIFQRIVAVIARSGFDHRALDFDLGATGNEFKKRIGDEPSFVTSKLSADYMGGVSVVVRGQRGLERVGEDSGFALGKAAATIEVRL